MNIEVENGLTFEDSLFKGSEKIFARAVAGFLCGIIRIFDKDKEKPMSRRCDLLGTGPMSGNNVSHAMNKTRRRFEPNLCNVTLASDVLGQNYKLRITAATLRTVDFKGGLDTFLMGTKNAKLTDKAKKIKKALIKKQAEAAEAAA